VQRTALKLPQIISEEELPLLNDEWKIYQAQDIPEDWDVKRMEPQSTDGLTTTGKKCFSKIPLVHHTKKYYQS
jgi:hypothetical protein